MPEAVIVSATRSPIGRAKKGSLKSTRPDDLAAHMISSALEAVPELDNSEIDDIHLGCTRPGSQAGFNMARVVSQLIGLDDVPGATLTRFCASSLQTDGQFGLETMCVGGGPGMATVLERLS